MGLLVKTGNTMNVIGIKFDIRLKWAEQVEMAIKGANVSLFERALPEMKDFSVFFYLLDKFLTFIN